MLLNVLQTIFALAVTLGLIGAAAYGVRRFAPSGLLQLGSPTAKRLQVLETLIIGSSHRLVLVRVGTEERLVLLGEGRLLEPTPSSASRL
jgi:flagellar protein FliO/FliZ